MKKKLGALVLTLSALAIPAGCASSGAASKPSGPHTDSGETWEKGAPSGLPGRSANAAPVRTSRLASP